MATPAFVQATGNSSSTTASTPLTKAFTSNNTAGNCIVVHAYGDPASGTALLPVITDSNNNQYQLVTGTYFDATTPQQVAVFAAFNVAAGANTVTVTYNYSHSFASMIIAEFSGATCLGSVDSPAHGNTVANYTASSANGTALSSPSITPSNANELLLAFGMSNSAGSMTVGGSGWTLAASSGFCDAMVYKLSVSGSYAGAFSTTGSAAWACGIIALAGPPVIASPAGGCFDLPTIVTLSNTQGYTIYYTTNGTTPTTASTQYTGPFLLSSACTLQAIAVGGGTIFSAIGSWIFQIGGNIAPQNGLTDTQGNRVWDLAGKIMSDPVSGLWYLYGSNESGPGVYEGGINGVQCYSSADLRNWTNHGIVYSNPGPINTNKLDRPCCLYNAANNNYVLWVRNALATLQYLVLTASSPTGPFTLQQTYTTLDGNSTAGDFTLFQDTDGSAWIFYNDATEIGFSKLTANYQATDGVNHTYYANTTSSPFGQASEGHGVAKVGSTYFWMCSTKTEWVPNTNLVVAGTSLTSPSWGTAFNPFQATSDTNSEGAIPATYGITITTVQNFAYDTQSAGLFVIPGRGGSALMWSGDRYDNGDTSPTVTQSITANFNLYKKIWLPAVVSGSAFTITWSSSWNLDTQYPPTTNLPAAPTNVGIIGGSTLLWTNNATGAVQIYIDSADDSLFTTNVQSRVLGAFAPGSMPSSATVSGGNFYRVRVTNASGTGTSSNANPITATSGLVVYVQSNGLIPLSGLVLFPGSSGLEII